MGAPHIAGRGMKTAILIALLLLVFANVHP